MKPQGLWRDYALEQDEIVEGDGLTGWDQHSLCLSRAPSLIR